MERIVVATDGSQEADSALELCADIADRFSSEVFVVHVLTNLPIGTYALFPVPDTIKNLLHADEERAFKRAREILDERSIDYKTVTRKGEPAEEIINAAKELGADTIVMGRRGLGAAGRWLLGSVSDRVTHGADCTVMLASHDGEAETP